MVTLNCDMGESFGNWSFGDDEGIMPFVDFANIACGFHASDPSTMASTVKLAAELGKGIGAHPSLPDKEGFGRRAMVLKAAELRECFIYQLGALSGFLRAEGLPMAHLKPHGIVYGMAAQDENLAIAIAQAAAIFNVPLFGMAGTAHEFAANKVGIPFIGEFFADLQYSSDGGLIIPRVQSAVDIEAAVERIKRALETAQVAASDGTMLDISFQTICIHSDPPNARNFAKEIRRVLDEMVQSNNSNLKI